MAPTVGMFGEISKDGESILEIAAWKRADEYCTLFNSKPSVAPCSKLCETSGTTWNFWSYREVGRIRRPRGLGTMEGHRQSSSRMTLFSFATQATERVPGTSIEKSRGWVLNLAAYLRHRPMGDC